MPFELSRKAFHCLFLLCFLLAKKNAAEKAPIITSVEQIDETGIRIRWNDHNEKNLVRYRIFYSNDRFNVNFKEWPGQIEKSQQSLIGDLYHTLIVNSSFECYINCIKNPGCDFAVSTEGTSCHLKLYNPKSSNLKLNASFQTEYGEYIFIPKYTNEVILRDLPVNDKYYFQVATLKENSKEFSELSSASKPIENRIGLAIFSDVNEENRVRIFWRQVGNFLNHEISRYIVKIWSDNEPLQTYSVIDGIQIAKVRHDYFDLTSAFSIGRLNDESECFERCLSNSSCIKYSMFADKECCLMSSLDLHNSVYKVQNSIIRNLKSSASSFVFENLKPKIVWKVKVEFKNMYGIVGFSNIIEVIQNEIIEEKKPTTPKITSATTSLKESEYFYDDYSDFDNLVRPETNTESKTSTKTSITSKSIDNEYDYYDLYSDLIEKIPPEIETLQIKTTSTASKLLEDDDSKTTINNEDHAYDSYEDFDDNKKTTDVASIGRIIVAPDMDQIKSKISIKIDQTISSAKVGDELIVKCLSNQNVIWKFNNITSFSINKVIETGLYESTLVFNKLQRYDQGVYTCNLVNDNSIFKSAKILVNGVPSKPVIRNVSVFETSTFIEWNPIELRGANVQKLFVEWSEDFTDGFLPVKKRISSINEYPDILLNKILLDIQLPYNFFVRISVLNNFNEYSPVSEPVQVDCRHSNCVLAKDENAKAAEVKDQGVKKKHKHLKRTFNSATVTLLSLIGILLVLISCYIFYDCMRKNQTRQIILRDEHDKRYNKVPTESEI